MVDDMRIVRVLVTGLHFESEGLAEKPDGGGRVGIAQRWDDGRTGHHVPPSGNRRSPAYPLHAIAATSGCAFSGRRPFRPAPKCSRPAALRTATTWPWPTAIGRAPSRASG